MPHRSPSLHLIVNAGGQSRRMGRDKAWLPVPPDDRPLLWHVVERLRPLAALRTVVVVNQLGAPPPLLAAPALVMVPDAYPGAGALGGVATGLRACSDWAVVVACDMPLVMPRVLQPLLAMAGEQTDDGGDRWDAIVPDVGGMLQPFHALYHPRCLPAIEHSLRAGELQLRSFLDHVRARIVPEDELALAPADLCSFVNVNTPAEWAAALVWLQDESANAAQ